MGACNFLTSLKSFMHISFFFSACEVRIKKKMNYLRSFYFQSNVKNFRGCETCIKCKVYKFIYAGYETYKPHVKFIKREAYQCS